MPPAVDARTEVRDLCRRIALDGYFLWLARISGRDRRTSWEEEIGGADYRVDWLWVGGQARRLKGRVVVSVARWPAVWRSMIAAHELFHLARDFNGAIRLDDRRVVGWRVWNWWRVWWEEIVVWGRTAAYAPLGTLSVWVPLILLVVGLFVTTYLSSRGALR
jgi:hypothetical protein